MCTSTAILLVADDPALRRLKRHYLEQAGYAVEEALDGPATLDRLRVSPRPLVAIMNVRVPGIGAAGILGAAREEAKLRRHGFVLVTAVADMLPEDVARLTRELRVPAIGKPFTAESLLAAVAAAHEHIVTHDGAYHAHASAPAYAPPYAW